jgi:hypothetical protein
MKKIMAIALMAVLLASCGSTSLGKVFDSGHFKIGYNDDMTIINDESKHWIEGNFKIAFGVTSSKLFEVKDFNAPPVGLIGFAGEGIKVEKTVIHGLEAMWIEGKTEDGAIFACLYPLEGATVYAYTELLSMPKSEADVALARRIVESLEVTSPDLAVAVAKEQEKEEIAKPMNAVGQPSENMELGPDLEDIVKQMHEKTGIDIDKIIKDETNKSKDDSAIKIIDRYKLMKEYTKPQDR